ncbi:unnamed protein product [Angiostrongylus costaricensis]|uniref:Aldedh domain-containing protein n=1 Tax=Angiostrongylus costaricensis TaxID=334426 RepID=A0A158PK05_ANGCS|nr:unnamed protein product [Angiostrongylus costaricensis]
MDDIELSRAEVGDLIFLAKFVTSSLFEQAVFDCASSPFYHVAIIANDRRIVHALPCGVLCQSFGDFLTECEPHCTEILHVKVSEELKIRAANFSESKTGLPYNDIFSPDCVNSVGEESYYCSQLITEAYRGVIKFPEHKLNFRKKDGQFIEFWEQYYEARKRRIPQDEPGSHPASIRRAPELAMRLIRNLQQQVLKVNDITNALHFIGGAAVNFTTGQKFEVVEPRSGRRNLIFRSKVDDCHNATANEVSRAVETAHEARQNWSRMGWLERGNVLKRVAETIRKNLEEISRWECLDSGKPIYEARLDVLSCVDTFNYYAGAGQALVGEHIPLDQDRFAFTKREPLGVVGCIGAWNYPIQTCTWKIAPALACGNSVVYKPSPLSPVSAVILAKVLQLSGLPDGVFNIVQGHAETGTALIQHPLVKKISFTGSISTGRKIMQGCAVRNIKPVTLELGGKSSLIIFEDADIQSAVSGAMMANFFSQGQVCTNASKVLVHRSMVEEFVASLREKTCAMRVGDPLDETTRVGAHISRKHMETVKKYIDDAVSAGARLVCGGEMVSVAGLENGFYLSPCVLSDIRKDMAVYREEIFGAVLLVIPFDSEDEAVSIANDTTMGLAAGLFTK